MYVDPLEIFLRNKELAVQRQKTISTDVDIEFALCNFDNINRLEIKKSILEFWEENRNTYPYTIYQIAMVVLGAPATQVSVERSFSGLKFILRDNRGNLSKKMLEDILLIRGNFNLV